MARFSFDDCAAGEFENAGLTRRPKSVQVASAPARGMRIPVSTDFFEESLVNVRGRSIRARWTTGLLRTSMASTGRHISARLLVILAERSAKIAQGFTVTRPSEESSLASWSETEKKKQPGRSQRCEF
jgi:hypothetical protein